MTGRRRLWLDGHAHASREAVARMHAHAEGMTDPAARAVLAVAADDPGHHFAAARRRLREAAAEREDM